MTDLHRMLLIDPEKRTIEEVLAPEKKIGEFIGNIFTTAYTWRYDDHEDVLVVDDEGLLKDPRFFFSIPERTDQPLAGRGVIFGADASGETVYARMSLGDLIARVKFYSVEDVAAIWR